MDKLQLGADRENGRFMIPIDRAWQLGVSIVMMVALAGCQTPADPLGFGVVSHDGSKQAPAVPANARPAATAPRTTGRSPGASSVRGMTLEGAVDRVVAYHPAVDEGIGRVREADERIRSAQAAYYPSIDAGVNSGYQNTGSRGWQPRFEVTVEQLLYDFGKASSSVQSEVAGEKVSEAQLLGIIDMLARDAAGAVIEVQRYRMLTRLSREQLDGVRTIAALVQDRTDSGASTMSDRVQADARVQSAEATLFQNESEYDRWRAALAAMVGANAAEVDPVDTVPSWFMQSCSVRQPDWTNVPAILEAGARKEVANAQLDGSQAEFYPTISLQATSAYHLYSRDDALQDDNQDLDYFVGVKASSSLYNGGRTSARRRAAAHAKDSADASMRAARLETQRALQEAGSRIGTLNSLSNALAARSDMMATTRDLYREQYLSLGTRTLLDLLNAEQELHEARFQMATTTHDIRRLNLDCLYSSGLMRQRFAVDPSRLRAAARGG